MTGRQDVTVRDVVASDFHWVSRESDVLFRAYGAQYGEFLVLNELQFRYTVEMPRRMRAYAALAEERYRLPVYPVLVNILPPSLSTEIADHYESKFMGLVARQDYRVINLWEVDAEVVFRRSLATLIPFTPVLLGGGDEKMVRKAVHAVRSDERLGEMEPLLAFFASFALETSVVQQIMRWDMDVVGESPWYQELLKEGREQATRQQLLRILEHRFGPPPTQVRESLASLDLSQLDELVDAALTVDSLDEFVAHTPDQIVVSPRLP